MENYDNLKDFDWNENTDLEDNFFQQILDDNLPQLPDPPEKGFADRTSQSRNNFLMNTWLNQIDQDRPGITFVIPNNRDNQHIDNIVRLREMLEKVGNEAIDAVEPSFVDSRGQAISHEQISQSAVLNLADLQNSALDDSEKGFFDDFDMNSIINYLWIVIVAALVFLSLIFLIFSFYFYKKFRQWKKCSKYFIEIICKFPI